MKIIDDRLLNDVSAQAKTSPRLRMNYNFHSDLSDKCQRLLNALEPGTELPIHHHKVDEMFVILRGRVKVLIYNDIGEVTEETILCHKSGLYGVNIPAHTWHSVESLEPDSVIFEVKEGPYVPHEIGGILKK